MLHPLTLALGAVDLGAAALAAAAGLSAARVLLGWRAGAAGLGQLRLERRAESASIQGRAAAAVFALGTLLLVVAVTAVLPGVVPGAMCGTGVVQAMPNSGRVLTLRLLAMGALGAWALLDRLDRSEPSAPLALGSARGLLLAMPLLGWSAWESWAGLSALDVQRAVDCCAMIYGQVAAEGAGTGPGWYARLDVAGAGAVALALGAAGLMRRPASLRLGVGVGVLAVLWAPMAAAAMVEHLSPYHYGVLSHRCPWCLFLSEHWAVGYPMFAALLWVAFGGGGIGLASLAGQRVPVVLATVQRQTRWAAARLVLALVVFVSFAGGPAVLWWWRHGVLWR